MSNPSDQMQLKEDLIREKYGAVEKPVLGGFDHAPRLAKKSAVKPGKERSAGALAQGAGFARPRPE